MQTQPELDLFSSRKTARTSPQDDASYLRLHLRGRGWVCSGDLGRELSWSDRRIRAAAEAADGEILSGPGSPGYILTREASADDRDRIIAALRSQGRLMLRRSLRIARVHHRPA
jgi:hypothetical protein